MQTTFMNVQRGLDRGVVPQFELAWLFKIARNVCYNRSDSTSRRRRVEAVHDLDSLQDVLATPERTLNLSIGELTHALGAIPERQRRALLLREFQGMSYEEIAGELGISVAAVETLLFRARRSLSDQLEQTGMPRRRGAVASAVALFRWFFDGSAVPLKLAAVTAAVATTATMAVAPALRSDPAGPVRSIPNVVMPGAQTRTPVSVGNHVGRATGARARGPQTVHVTSTGATSAQGEAPGGSSAARGGSSVHPLQAQPATTASSATASTPPPPQTTLPTVQDVTQVVPDTTLPISVQLPQLAPVGLPVDTPQVPELPKLP